MLELTKENYDKTVDGSEIVVIDCWQQFCAPCAQFAPIFEKTSEKYPEIAFAKLNSQVETSISDHFFIQTTPTTVRVPIIFVGTSFFNKHFNASAKFPTVEDGAF